MSRSPTVTVEGCRGHCRGARWRGRGLGDAQHHPGRRAGRSASRSRAGARAARWCVVRGRPPGREGGGTVSGMVAGLVLAASRRVSPAQRTSTDIVRTMFGPRLVAYGPVGIADMRVSTSSRRSCSSHRRRSVTASRLPRLGRGGREEAGHQDARRGTSRTTRPRSSSCRRSATRGTSGLSTPPAARRSVRLVLEVDDGHGPAAMRDGLLGKPWVHDSGPARQRRDARKLASIAGSDFGTSAGSVSGHVR